MSITREIWDIGDTIAILHENIRNASGDLITDFNNYVFNATLKSSKSDADASALVKINTSAFTITAADSKAVGFLATESIRSSITVGQDYYLDAQIVDGAGNVATTLRRRIEFRQDISRRYDDS